MKNKRTQQDIGIRGTDPLKGFAYHFDFSLPYIAVAIHAGHHVRKELKPLMALDSGQRRFEEDTGTDLLIKGLGNAAWALESRAVYDLNRSKDMALPLTKEKFWGTRVYKTMPDPGMNQKSLESHESFYRFIKKYVTGMLDRFGICIVYDIHSYNISRQKAKGIKFPPVFNLGTKLLNTLKWKEAIELWLELLGDISLPGVETTVAENLVFYGKAEFCRQISSMDERILVLPTEISKAYMDEKKGILYPDVVKALKTGLEKAVLSHARHLIK
ncbi:MAG: N-formylglutamate amidohydrolase [Deltaproteobacteria bacterium]|nr:N-formylglutamate amidohydrolase [Deltaproteobacteria bacterium]